MAMFLLHISFLLALALAAAGLVLWHQGRQLPGAGSLRIASVVLIAGSVLSALCIAYYGVRYHVQGDFEHAYAQHPPMHGGRMMEGGGMMEGAGMMNRMERREERGPMGRPEAAGEATRPPATPGAAEHEAHHPEGAAPR
jgi:hypothetical protein